MGFMYPLYWDTLCFLWKRKDAENKEEQNAENFQFVPADPHSTLSQTMPKEAGLYGLQLYTSLTSDWIWPIGEISSKSLESGKT